MLVTLEGLDGSGKSSCVEILKEANSLPETTFTREPTNSWYGEAVSRSITDDEADSLAELFLYTADHADHLSRVVRPALDRGELVISDRYSDSRYAYQGATLDDRFDDAVGFVRAVHEPWTRPPDMTIYLDVDPKTGATRSGATNKFETASYLETVRNNYERLITEERERFVRVDATQSSSAVKAEVRNIVESMF